MMSVDTTFNLGEFYVTPITYHHAFLEVICTGKPPIMIGSILIHQRVQFATFNYFLSTLVVSNKNLWNLMTFGTDGDQNLPMLVGTTSLMHYSYAVSFTLNEICKRNFMTWIFSRWWLTRCFWEN